MTMPPRTVSLSPLSAAMAQQIRTLRYALFEPGVDPAVTPADDLAALAHALIQRRKGRGITLGDSALVWGETPDESRAAITLAFTLKDGSIDQVLTVLCWSERAGGLWQALDAARSAMRRAA